MKLSIKLLSVALFIAGSAASAQQVPVDTLNKYGLYDLDRLPGNFHAGRRTLVLDSMQPNSIAVFMAAQKKNRANDVDYEYHQDPNFYYLTGHLEPYSALVLTKDEGGNTSEVLFVQRRNELMETWEGKRLGREGSKQILGFKNVLHIDSLEEVLATSIPGKSVLYYTPNYARGHHDPVSDHTHHLHDENDSVFKVKFPAIERRSLERTLGTLRMAKTPDEITLLRKAIDITTEAHNEIMRSVEPGWHEYEIQALGEYIFKKNGSEYPGYPCIVGSGENSVILHYNTNRRKTKNGDIVEMDIGAEYHGYTADVTRSYPINGKFTEEQRTIYNIVLEAQDSGIAECQVGRAFRAPHNAAMSVITRGLLQLGIIKNASEARKYFMHGTSHYIGLDVHDPSTGGPLPINSVITVEPGIYIKEGSDCDPKWWNIGIRIEDDILVTPQGPVNLSIASPRTADAVEALMRESGKAMNEN